MRCTNEIENFDNTLRLLTPTTEEYLLDLFWNTYMAPLPYVNKQLFLVARRDQNPRYYSKSLHVCLLMVGSRFADPTHPGVRQLMTDSPQNSRFYLVAKQLVEEELESAATLPLVQALLLLGDTEATFGHYNKGWLYVGKCLRTAPSFWQSGHMNL